MNSFLRVKALHVLMAAAIAFSAVATFGSGTPVLAAGATVLIDNLQPSWTAPGGGGVWSAYYGPNNSYAPVSPGSTQLYDGREAGIIKAGLTIDPVDNIYEDEGLFGFQPNVTIDEFAAAALSYDVENQEGTNPVWITIEIETGDLNTRDDNPNYQYVPTAYGAGWHTVDAANGQWQLMDANGNGTGPLLTLSQIAADPNNTGKQVIRAYLRLGMGDSYHGTGNGTVAWVDKAVIAGTTYDFVVPHFWYVAPDGSDSNEGSEISPFKTIQHAVDSAATGETIHVAAGTYNEVVDITKPLSLLGQTGAVIKPDNTTAKLDSTRRPAIYVEGGVNGVTIEGFEVDGTAGEVNDGVYALNSNGTTVRNNVIHDITTQVGGSTDDSAGVGIMIFGWGPGIDNGLIEGNTVYNTGRMGIFVGGMQSSDPYNFVLSTGNTVRNNTVHHAWQGPTTDYGGAIQVNCGKNTTISGNTVHDTGASANWYGIYLGGSSTGNAVSNNEIYANATGIAVWNNVTWCDWAGSAVGTPAIHLNSIHGNTAQGLRNVDTDAAYLVDATQNWWGNASGPSDVGLGTGDKVSSNVNFSPWCADSGCSTFLPPYPTTTTITSDTPDPSSPAKPVTIKFHVANTVSGGPVPAGTVAVKDGSTVLCGAVALDGSGNGTCSRALATSGLHTLTAVFTPTSTSLFSTSTGNATHKVTTIVTRTSARWYDGWTLESGPNSSVGGSMNATADTFRLGDDAGNRQYRSILSFNTFLPKGAVITKATLKIKQSGAPVGTNPFKTLGNVFIDIKPGTFGLVGLQLTDFQEPVGTSGKNAAMVIRNNPVGAWYSATLTPATSLINRAGITQFRLRFALGDNKNGQADYLQFFSGDASIAGNQPQLILEYYVP